MTLPLSCVSLMPLAALAALACASAVRADVGVLPTVVEGFTDPKLAERRQEDLDRNVKETLLVTRVPLTLRCDAGSFDHPPDAKCVKEAVNASARDVDEVVQVLLKSVGANNTVMKLRIFGRDGAVVQEPVQELIDVQAAEVTTVMLRKAFDPSRFAADVTIAGAPPGAQLLVDGLPVASDAKLPLRVGPHVLDVVREDGSVEPLRFDVVLDKPMTVTVPVAPAAVAPATTLPFIVATSTAITGLVAAGFSTGLFFVAESNRAEWRRRATGRTFPRNSDDPSCKDAPSACLNQDGEQVGWTTGYGPLGEQDQVGQGARFMMVAFSRDNELRWEASSRGSVGGIIAGAAALAFGAASVIATWPDVEAEAEAEREATAAPAK